MAATRTHYQVLDVAPTASRTEIRDQYRRLVRLLHPDGYRGASESERRLADRRLREVTEAWSVIGDEKARSGYDRELATTAERVGASTAARTEPARPAPQRGPVINDLQGVFDAEDLDLDEDEVELSKPQAFLLRRGPVLVALAVLIGIFIGSAYAAQDESTPDSQPPRECVVTSNGRCLGQ